MGYYKSVATDVKRDNHWSKDHNGIWQRRLKLEGPRDGFAGGNSFENIIDYSAVIENPSPAWNYASNFTSWENVASCIAGGRAFKGTSGSTAGRITSTATKGSSPAALYSDNIEVISGIFEDAGQSQSQIYVLGNPQTSYVSNWWTWGVGYGETDAGNAVLVDGGYEDLGIGPNGGQLVRIWMAFDTSVTDFTGEYRSARWETDNTSSPETGILHHAQYIEIPSGYSALDNGAPSSIIVTNQPEENPTLWGSGFEDETSAFTTDFTSKNEGSGNSAIVATGFRYRGSNSAMISFGGTTSYCTIRKDGLGNLAEMWVRHRFLISWNWGMNATCMITQLRDASFGHCLTARLEDSSGWKISLYNTKNYGQIGGLSAALTTGVWHELKMHYVADTDGTDGVGEAWLDGTLFASSSTEDFDLATINKLWLGVSDSNTPTNGSVIRYDDVRVETYDPGSFSIRREAEQFSIPITFNPQELSVYARFTQRWRDADHTVFSIGGSSGERLKVTNNNGTGGTFFIRHHDGSSYVESQVGSGAIDWGDTVEVIGVLWDDGKVRGYISINGGAWTTPGDSATLAFTGSWGEDLVHIGSIDDSNTSQGFIELEAFKIVNVVVYNTALCEWLRGYKEDGF